MWAIFKHAWLCVLSHQTLTHSSVSLIISATDRNDAKQIKSKSTHSGSFSGSFCLILRIYVREQFPDIWWSLLLDSHSHTGTFEWEEVLISTHTHDHVCTHTHTDTHIQTAPTNPPMCAWEIRCILHTLSTFSLSLPFPLTLAFSLWESST